MRDLFPCIKYINRLRQPGEFVQSSALSSGHPPALAREAILRNCVGFGHCHCHYCHSDRQFCVCSKIYIPPFVGSTTRSHNQAWETRLNMGKSQEDGIHHDVGLPDFVCFTFLCGIWQLYIQITYPNDSRKRVFGRLQLLDFIAEFSLNPFLLCLRLPEIRAEAVKQLDTQTVLPINLHAVNWS